LARRASRLLAGGGAERNPRIPVQRAIRPGRGGGSYATNLPDTTLAVSDNDPSVEQYLLNHNHLQFPVSFAIRAFVLVWVHWNG